MAWRARLSRIATLYRAGDVRQLAGRLAHRLFSRAGAAYRAGKARDDAAFDADGYDTGGVQHLHTLSIIGPNAASGEPHLAAPPEEFAGALALLDLDPAGLTFVDLGSGKGRALLLAAERPFHRLVGVEFARELHDAAVANFAARAARLGPDPRVELLNADAAAYPYPDEPLLLFVFNAFNPPVLTTVARAALASWRARPRPMRVLYMNPVFANEWRAAGWRELASGGGAILYAPPED